MPRIADPLEDVQGRLLLSAYRSVYDSGRSRLRGCRQGSSVEQIVGVTQGLASPSHPSLMTRQHWLRRPALLDDARSRAHDRKPGLLRENYLVTMGWPRISASFPGYTTIVATHHLPMRILRELLSRPSRIPHDTPERATALLDQSFSAPRRWLRPSVEPFTPLPKGGSQHRRLKQEKNPWSNRIETCCEKASSNVAAQLD